MMLGHDPAVDHWLFDGALLRDAPFWKALKTHPSAVALYADLGEQAAEVGPWLLPGEAWSMPAKLGLPWLHGVHALSHRGALQDLQSHFAALRHLWTDDGQCFYLRIADARTLNALSLALPDAALRRIRGPVLHWHHWGFDGTPKRFAPRLRDEPAVSSKALTLTLTLKQFETLIEAGDADRLAEELTAAHEEAIKPTHDARQFQHVLAALDFAKKEKVVSSQLRRDIARAGILSDGAVYDEDTFTAAVHRAAATHSGLDRDAWQAGHGVRSGSSRPARDA